MDEPDLPVYDLLKSTKKVPAAQGKQRSFRLTKETDNEVARLAISLGETYDFNITHAHMIRVLVMLSLQRIREQSKVRDMMSIINESPEDSTQPAPEVPPEENDLEEQYVLNLLQQSPINSIEEWDPQG